MATLPLPETLDVPCASTAAYSTLFLDGLGEFVQRKWGVTQQIQRISEGSSELPAVEVHYFLDAKGRIWKPPNIPYLAARFQATPTRYRGRIDRQWLAVGSLLAEDMARRGVAMVIPLPPEISDVRPWQWAGFRADARYTFAIDLPYDPAQIDSGTRRYVARARKAGFRCERTLALGAAVACLQETEGRQGFTFDLNSDDLDLAQQLIGEEGFRQYVGYAPDGTPATAAVVLHAAGGCALGLVFGTSTAYLGSGVAQLVVQSILDDLTDAGAARFDFVGANLPSVATAKSGWGARLKPFYTVDGGRARALARHARDYWQFQRRRAP
jgi:hypothetical protein